MKTVVITGSARGFGLEMLKCFRTKGYNVVICDINEDSIDKAEGILNDIKSNAKIYRYRVDITKEDELNNMISDILTHEKTIDIWVNNAGVNQPNKAIWELDKETIDRLIDIDLKGTILASKAIVPIMIKQNFGQIYNVEGYGSNDAVMLGLSLYGTSKRAITYFTEALANEVKERNYSICVGKLAPGIMITNFISTALGDGEKINLDEKTKKVYNILGDYSDVIAKFMVNKMVVNTKNNVKFTWLTNGRAAFRFMTSGFNKRDFFK